MTRKLFGLIVILFIALPRFSSAQTEIYQEWVNYENTGLWISSDRKCQLRLLEERRYKLFRDENQDGPQFGIYNSILHGRWIKSIPTGCRHPTLGMGDLFLRNRTWSIDLASKKKGVFAVQAIYKDCRGDGCNSPELFKGAFTTILMHSGSELRDQGDATLINGSQVFKSLSDEKKQNYLLVKQFLERWISMRVATSLTEFSKQNIDPRFFAASEEQVRILEQYRALSLGESHVGFEIIEAYLLLPGIGAVPAEPILFFQVANRRNDGRKLLEMFELTKWNGVWRLASFKY